MYKWFFITIFIACFFLSGCGSACKQKDPGSCIPAYPEYNEGKPAVNPMRCQMLQETATGLGAQAGLAWRGHYIDCALEKDERNLDQVFNFRAMLLKHNVLPPVLAEGNKSLNLANSTNIRLADRIYKILSPPRFVTAPPTWREYLWMDFPPPEKPNKMLIPKNQAERKIWNVNLIKGWKCGIDQADQIFSINLGRLKRDYMGIILYRKLLAQNMVSPPYVAEAKLGVTGDAKQIRIDDRVLRITATSKLNTKPHTWKPIVIKPSDERFQTPALNVIRDSKGVTLKEELRGMKGFMY